MSTHTGTVVRHRAHRRPRPPPFEAQRIARAGRCYQELTVLENPWIPDEIKAG
jgi:hypothetical protein